MQNESKVTISIVVYNSAASLRECLEAISESVNSGKAEVIVINNNSPDESLEIAKEFSRIKIIDLKENLGFAGGHNLAWQHVNNKYWLLLNPDAVFYPQSLEKLVEWMDLRPEVGAASPDILDSNENSISPGRRFPSLFQSIVVLMRIHHLLPGKHKAKLPGGDYSTEKNEHQTVEWVPGTAMIVRREAVEEIGLLSEEFFMYGEDIEWCWRFQKAGWKIGVSDSSKVRHYNSISSVKTWGETGKQKKMLQGIYKVVIKMRGKVYAKLLFSSYFLSSVLASINPFRSKSERDDSYNLALNYLQILTKRENKAV